MLKRNSIGNSRINNIRSLRSSDNSRMEKMHEPKRNIFSIVLKIFLVLVLLGVVAFGVSLAYGKFFSKKDNEEIKTNNNEIVQKRVLSENPTEAEILEVLGKHVNLPITTTSPIIAVISEPEKLIAQQEFFRGVEIGDLLIVYQNLRAYVYRPSIDKVVKDSPVIIDTASSTAVKNEEVTDTSVSSVSSSEETVEKKQESFKPESVKVEIRNGSNISGRAGRAKSDLEKLSFVDVIGTKNAETDTYSKTLIIDLTSGKKPNALKVIKEQTNSTVTTTLPKGAPSSTADFVLILGGPEN
jgi:hypothetical protein